MTLSQMNLKKFLKRFCTWKTQKFYYDYEKGQDFYILSITCA